MVSMKSLSIIVFLTLLSLGFLFITEAEDPTYVYHSCSNTTNFIANSTYQFNLHLLLSSLSSINATSTKNGFFNTTTGQNPDQLYGLFLCRADVSAQVCQDCVAFATQDIVRRCPLQKTAIIWYDECFLRYSSRSIFSTPEQTPMRAQFNLQNVNQESFNNLVEKTINEETAKAAGITIPGAKKFAAEVVNISSFQNLYSLVQCRPDLSEADCNWCFHGVIGQLRACCDGKIGANVLTPSCSVRYELYPFYNLSVVELLPPQSPPPPRPSSPPPPPLIRPKRKSYRLSTIIISIVVPIAVSILLFVMGCCFLIRRARTKPADGTLEEENAGNEITTVESLQFDLATIEAATNFFCQDNQLGAGGFGQVYKGTLPNGQEIAVKRLSADSGQGIEEFKSEVLLVAKLQHRNLVRLLGFCLERQEKIVVYEFVPNKSLDYFIYDADRQVQLNWSQRYKIIERIARGLLYLHEDFRYRIIHRDLKPSNILLDHNMDPKISDFGIAKICGIDQSQGNTNKILGTYGYMSPEYAMYGQFSTKSDVYSFGVLILEIITGKKSSSFNQTDGVGDLISYVWKRWTDGAQMEVMDPTLKTSYSRNEVIRCIQIGLLCVHQDPTKRPTMATIILMLGSHSITQPLPQQPVNFVEVRSENTPTMQQATHRSLPLSAGEEPITEVYPR